jgi:hypothetical protein
MKLQYRDKSGIMRLLGDRTTSMNAFAISILVASICVLKSTAEDVPRPSPTTTESPATEMDEPALPAPEQNPPASSPDLLPESNELPEHVPAERPTNAKVLATTATENIEENQRFERIRSRAANDPHASYLLKRANHSIKSATRRNYLRAYYVSLADRMRKLDPKLKASIDTYERAKIHEIGARNVSQHTSRIVHRRTSRKTRYAGHHSHSHRYLYERVMVEDPYGPYDAPYFGPPVVFYPW